jgi:hypothetical protein
LKAHLPILRGMSATAERLTASRTPRLARLSDGELARLRRKVDGGEPLRDTEAAALLAEMERATSATKPATAALQHAIDVATERRGRPLAYIEIELLWETVPGLKAIKQLHDRERACWRRASGILRESNVLQRGETIRVERRAPHPVQPAVAPEFDRRRPNARKRPWQR